MALITSCNWNIVVPSRADRGGLLTHGDYNAPQKEFSQSADQSKRKRNTAAARNRRAFASSSARAACEHAAPSRARAAIVWLDHLPLRNCPLWKKELHALPPWALLVRLLEGERPHALALCRKSSSAKSTRGLRRKAARQIGEKQTLSHRSLTYST
jgi:hypothetical protein